MNNGNYALESGGFERSQDAASQALSLALRVALPCRVVSFDADRQTVSAQPEIAQLLSDESTEDYPVLLDVPVFVQRGGKYVATMPIAEGDPCLVIFGDRCIDAWFSGGSGAAPADFRMHDLSDGFAIVGFSPIPQAVKGYNANSAEMRSLDGTQTVKLDPDGTITNANPAGSTVLNAAGQFIINAPGGIFLNGNTLLAGNLGTNPGFGGTGMVTLAADLVTSGNVTAGSVSLRGHSHANPEGGNVGPPFGV